MNEMDGLKDVLKNWQPEVAPPADFNSQVWMRIAAREEERSNRWWNRLALLWLQPKWCAAVAALVFMAAVAGGQIQSQITMEKNWENLETRYLASIDPYAHGGK
jgi:hypothetical protein